MIDKVTTTFLSLALVAAVAAVLALSAENAQLDSELAKARTDIGLLQDNKKTLVAAVEKQNSGIGALEHEGEKAIKKSKQALADIQPFVEEEERRILGIRSAQYSSASSDANERLENIRQKMLQDALL